MAETSSLVSRNVRAEIARAGRTQTSVASAIGVPRHHWQRRIRGVVDWRVGELFQIATVLGVPLSALTGEAR